MLIRLFDSLADHVTVNLGYHLCRHTTKEKDSKQAAGVTIFCGLIDLYKGRFKYFVVILD